MADKELRGLKRRDLLQMLIAQCEETERLQQEADKANAQLRELGESYERLKAKLNVKDERLNQKDARIAELQDTIEEMKASKEIQLAEAGSIAEAALRLSGIFEAAQEAADLYLMNVKKYVDTDRSVQEEPAEPVKFQGPNITVVSKEAASPVNEAGKKHLFEAGWGQDIRRKIVHG